MIILYLYNDDNNILIKILFKTIYNGLAINQNIFFKFESDFMDVLFFY